jgi:1-acyl-sn-glycerol-3-phosphate acyltransferase
LSPRRWLLLPLQWLALQHMLLLLGLGSLLWNLAALLLYPLLPRATGRRIGRAAIAMGYRIFWSMARLAGLIVVANHPSMLDAMMLVARLPHSACIMKASLMRNPFLAPGARLARYIRNDSAHGLVRRAVDDLRQGGQLVMFPEGTRTTVPPVNAFHRGVTLIAKRAAAPIQTVFIDAHSPYLCKGWPLWRLPPLPIVFSVRLGRRFEPADDPAALLRELEAYFAAGVRRPAVP